MPCIICKWNLTGTLCTSGALRGTLRERFEPLREAPLPSPFTNGDNSPRSGSRLGGRAHGHCAHGWSHAACTAAPHW